MCGICGCAEEEDFLTHENAHASSIHHHAHHTGELIAIEENLLSKNNQFAAENRHFLGKRKIVAINLMSSPGAGKTTLLAKTSLDLKQKQKFTIIVGDQQTNLDAEELKLSGAEAIQVNTGKICHLDAHRISHILESLSLQNDSILFIENIGNLVCPALFDLGEGYRVVILSVTEGETKPLKYPEMFRKADLLLLTKIDLLPYVNFNVSKCIEYAKRINPHVKILSVSATTGQGLTSWYQWLTAVQDE